MSLTKEECRRFYEACWSGKQDEVEKTLSDASSEQKKQLVQWHNFARWTSLHAASYNGKQECVRLLVEAGADIGAVDGDKHTALHMASGSGHQECVRLLVEAGADIGAVKYKNQTALHLACNNNHDATVAALLEAGADSQTLTDADKGLNALHYAAGRGWERVVKVLLTDDRSASLIEARTKTSETALMLACNKNHDATVAALLEAGADPQTLIDVDKGINELHYAAGRGWERVVKVLLTDDRSAGLIEARTKTGETALVLACRAKNEAVVGLLCAVASRLGLLCAVASRQTVIDDEEGFNILHYTVWQKWKQPVQFLLSQARRWDLVVTKSKKGDTSVALAKKGNDPDIIKIFELSAAIEIQAFYRQYSTYRVFCRKLTEENKKLRKMKAESVASSNPQELPAVKFVEAARGLDASISLDNVMLIRKKDFLSARCLPHYRRCAKQHCTASMIVEGGKVLFVSHRWGSVIHPDPDGQQYELICSFLDSPEGAEIEYIWADYSCIYQEKSSELFAIDLHNIPTAVFTAHYCLIIPKISEEAGVPSTDLRDYLGRAWCSFEANASIKAGSRCFIAFKVGNQVFFQRVTAKGISHVTREVWGRLRQEGFFNKENIDLERLFQQWVCEDPTHVFKMLELLDGNKDPAVQQILKKALCFEVTFDDVMGSGAFELMEGFKTLGKCQIPQDKIPVLNLLLFIWNYTKELKQQSEHFKESQDILGEENEEPERLVHVQRIVEENEELREQNKRQRDEIEQLKMNLKKVLEKEKSGNCECAIM